MPKSAPKPKPATKVKKLKADARATQMVAKLHTRGASLAIDELLLSTVLKGLKRVGAEARDELLKVIRADDRMVVIGDTEGPDLFVELASRMPAGEASADVPPPGQDASPEVEPEYVHNSKLDKLVEAFAGDKDACMGLAAVVVEVFGLKLSKRSLNLMIDEIQKDGRTEVFELDGINSVRLRVKSLGEMVEAAAEKPTELAKPISPTVGNAKIGDRLVHETHGPGKVAGRTDLTVFMAFDNAPNEDNKMFDLRFSEKQFRFEDPSTVTPKPEVIPEAAQFITEEERQANYHTALVAHAEAGKELARMHAAEKATETEEAETLKATRKRIEDIEARTMKHAAAMPTLEMASQRKIAFDVGPDTGTSGVGTPAAPAPDGFHPLPADQVLGLAQAGLTLDVLHQHLVETFEPGKKSKNVGKLAIEVRGVGWMVRSHSPDKTRWFLQQLVDREIWEDQFEEVHGKPVADWDADAESRTARTGGGADCGRLVKIARKQLVLAPESQGLVIVATKEAVDAYIGRTKAVEPSGKDAAAGE